MERELKLLDELLPAARRAKVLAASARGKAAATTSGEGSDATRRVRRRDADGGEEDGTLEFQAVSWYADDVDVEDGDGDGDSDDNDGDGDGAGGGGGGCGRGRGRRAYVIHACGVTADGRSVGLTIRGYTPFFFVRPPAHWTPAQVRALAQHVQDAYAKSHDVCGTRVLAKVDFWGFCNGQRREFVRVACRTVAGMRKLAAKLRAQPVRVPRVGAAELELYESNIDPLLRFLHLRDVAPAGWVRVDGRRRAPGAPLLPSVCDVDAECDWQDVRPEPRDAIAPLLVASFDIECNSAHGDFPMAAKDYRKLAADLQTAWETAVVAGAPRGLRALGEYDAKHAVLACMRAAFGLPHNPASSPAPGAAAASAAAACMARLELKQPLAPSGSRSEAQLRAVLDRLLDDVYTVLRGGRVPHIGGGGGGNKGYEAGGGDGDGGDAGNDDEDEAGDAHPEASSNPVLAHLLVLFNDALGRRWPLCGDAVIQIGTTVNVYGECEPCARFVLTLGSCDPVPGVTAQAAFEDEAAMLQAWAALMGSLDADVVTGYNIFGFDFAYMHARACELMGDAGAAARFLRPLSRLRTVGAAYKEVNLSSSALGDNVLRYVDMPGRVLVDMMKVVQRDHKLDSYKLDSVAEHFLGLRKHDVSPQDVFRLQRGGPADRRVIAEYCVQDCALCNQLLAKLQVLSNNVGMANVCSVPLSFIFMRGQGVKIFSLVAKQCRQDGYLVRAVPRVAAGPGAVAAADDGYEGAIVLEPQEGIYTDPVSVLDYASLYPSSMISENISHDSLVLDPRFDNLPGVEYVTVAYDAPPAEEGGAPRPVHCRFAQAGPKGAGAKAILPSILEALLRARKATRRRMACVRLLPDGPEGTYDAGTRVFTPLPTPAGDEGGAPVADVPPEAVGTAYDAFQLAVLDGLQNAYKVTANSLYGSMGARTSPLYLKHVAACTTAVGRAMILKAKAFLESPPWNARVVYGDSVAGHTPVVVRCPAGLLHVLAVEDLACTLRAPGADWRPTAGLPPSDDDEDWTPKEACELAPGTSAWSDAGWTPLRRVIRHALPPGKRMVRVRTGAGLVDVTTDHSLLAPGGAPVAPRDLRVGDPLMHAPLPAPAEHGPWPWPHSPTPQHAHAAGRRCVADASELPSAVLNAPHAVRAACWAGAQEGARARAAPRGTVPCQTHTIAAALWVLASSLGVRVYLGCSPHTWGVELLAADADADADAGAEPGGDGWEDDEAVVGVSLLPTGAPLSRLAPQPPASTFAGTHGSDARPPAPFVYDLTTANAHFAAGVGRLVVHNTDSLFCIFPEAAALAGAEAVAASIERAHAASAAFKPALKPPHDLEYDKTFWPFVLFSKKRYVGNLYEDDPRRGKLKSMGIALKRRDYAPIVKRVYGGAIDIVLNLQDVPAAARFVKDSLLELVEGHVPLEELIVTKTLRAYYKLPQQIAHFVLAQRMAERDPGNRPQPNDRIAYVYVEVTRDMLAAYGAKKATDLLQGQRIETPEHIRAHRLAPDYRHYITNQIMKPVLQLFALALEQLPGHRPAPETGAHGLQALVKEKGGDVKKAKERWCTLRQREVERLLFAPALAHPLFRERDNARNGQREITSFFSRATAAGG